nr:hypothetical protein CFP56_09029 [Quercus suber]
MPMLHPVTRSLPLQSWWIGIGLLRSLHGAGLSTGCRPRKSFDPQRNDDGLIGEAYPPRSFTTHRAHQAHSFNVAVTGRHDSGRTP